METQLNQENKQLVMSFWQQLEGQATGQVDTLVKKFMAPAAPWHGPDPINRLDGAEAFCSGFWRPLMQSFPDLRRHTHILFGGKSNGRIDGLQDGRMWVTGTGFFQGTFKNDYLGIPASGENVLIRWGEFCRIENGKIAETFFLLDLVDLIQQAGFEVLPPSLGKDGLYPPPQAGDGVLLEVQNEQESAYSLEHIRRFIFEGLNSYDESALESMGMADYFHPDVKWYGPGGIGACLSFREFEEFHQARWLHAFPDRAVQDLDALFAEGNYSGGPGWSGVLATHKGQYLDCPATGKRLEINGLDWWKREGEMYIENWVFVDMIHLFRQMGVDLLARIR